MPTEFIQIQVTYPNEEIARTVATRVVSERLAGCVQIIGPIRSHYVWKGIAESSEEFLMLAKTRLDLFEKFSRAIQKDHPYECAEIIALPIVAGSESYLNWLQNGLE